MSVDLGGHAHAGWDAAVRQLHPGQDPAGNLFIVALDGDGVMVGTVRFALPDPPDPDKTVRIGARLVLLLRDPGWAGTARCVAAAYGPPHLAGPVTELAAAAIAAAGVVVHDMVRVDGGRAWSYLCPDPDCHAGGPGLAVDPLSDTAIELATEIGGQQP